MDVLDRIWIIQNEREKIKAEVFKLQEENEKLEKEYEKLILKPLREVV